MNVISKRGLLKLTAECEGSQKDAFNWYRIAASADWACFNDVVNAIPNADFVEGKLVFNIRHNRYRLIVFPVFSRRTLYIKALMTHKEYERKEWVKQWP